MYHSLWLLLLCTVLSIHESNAQTDKSRADSSSPYDEDIQMLRRMVKNYEKASAPPNTPTPVQIGIYINSFYAIDSRHMEFGMSYYLRMNWQDTRLKFDGDHSVKAPDGFWDEIWTPDLFVRNEKDATTQSIITPHKLMKVNSTGHVWYVVKLSTTMACPMKLQKYPMDTQACPMMFESFGYTMDTIVLNWLNKPVDIDASLQLPEYTLSDVILNDCSQNYTAGAFPCLEISLILRRDIGAYLMQMYIPSFCLVIVSWLQFWLSIDTMTGRILVGLFSTFTVIAQLAGLRTGIVRVSYLTSMDVWMGTCLFFIFATLIEMAAVHLLENRSQKKSGNGSSLGGKIDMLCRLVFPVLFLLFNIIYWSLYASG